MVKLCRVNFLRGTKPVLTDFTLTVAKGERVCLFGPSGCGKTTALRLIAGLEKQESGSITVNGDISYVFQEHRLCPIDCGPGLHRALLGFEFYFE